jgi:aminopeptidase N
MHNNKTTRMRFVAAAGILALAWLAQGAGAASGARDDTARVVLPDSVTPGSYRIDFTPDAQAGTFSATVEIDVDVHARTDRVVLNAADLVIDRAELSGEAKAPVVGYDDKAQTASFVFGHALARGAHRLLLAYHGRINDHGLGLFHLDYETPAGPARALFTQFENSDARRFVPCWDEPGRKAVFELTATVPADQVALSNMPAAQAQPLPGGRQRVRFQPTPRMSSYLLFFGLGDFERVHRTVDGVDLGVVVKRGDTAQASFALDAAADILHYYNEYFGTPYPLPKLDMIAGPGDDGFFGAMENWGAIFYFEHFLLVDPRLSTEADKQLVYIVVAHEMAHQWFGDLVTMQWWDGIWLNEGFASWMEDKVTDHFHPEWKVWLQGQPHRQQTMGEDARDGTHPIITPIHDVLQASGAFDSITYTKGEAVIRTIESYLGEDAFRDGVRAYLREHAYGNAVTDELWHALDKDGAERPITRIAHDLTLQAGVPLVRERSATCTDGQTTVALTQDRFAIDPGSTPARLWHVPVTVATLGGTAATAVVSGPAPARISVDGCGPVILNAGQTAYFRSRYTDAGLAALAARLGELSPADQLGILSDTAELADAGQVPMAQFLDLTRRIPADADPVVVVALVERLRNLDRVYDALPGQEAFRAYARGVLNPFFARTGWDKVPGEPDNAGVLRGELIAALGALGDPEVLAQARERFERYARDPAALDAATRRSVLHVVAGHANAAQWDRLHEMARSAPTQMERQELYDLLAVVRDPGLARRALELSISAEPPATTRPALITAASYRHPQMAFDFVVTHWSQVEAMVGPGDRPRYVPRLLADASDPALIKKLEAFAAGHIPKSARGELRKAVANIRYRASIRKERLPEIDRWLRAQGV